MPDSFGARLRRQREHKQIALVSIAQQTKIHLPLLEALEDDNVSHWPSGIFRRAFLRAYAHAIGLAPDDVVREFMLLHPEPLEIAATETALVRDASQGERPRTRLQYVARAALDSIAGGWRGLFGANGVQIAEPPPRAAPASPPALVELDLLAAASLCTKLAQADLTSDVTLLLHEAARILNAVGLIVWGWDPVAAELKALLADGYPASVLLQLPTVRRDTDNATASAFRSARICAVHGSERTTSALAVPVMSPEGCVGVLAIELPTGSQHVASMRPIVTMFAAQMGRLIAAAPAVENRQTRANPAM